jgi:hypothetical protein
MSAPPDGGGDPFPFLSESPTPAEEGEGQGPEKDARKRGTTRPEYRGRLRLATGNRVIVCGLPEPVRRHLRRAYGWKLVGSSEAKYFLLFPTRPPERGSRLSKDGRLFLYSSDIVSLGAFTEELDLTLRCFPGYVFCSVVGHQPPSEKKVQSKNAAAQRMVRAPKHDPKDSHLFDELL